MAWRPHGHVKVNARNPRAAAICDRCGFPYNHNALSWQFDWAGVRLQNLKILVCNDCYDKPQRQLGVKNLSPDPVPIFNARPEPFTTTGFSYQESNILIQPPPNAVPSAWGAAFGPDFTYTPGTSGLDGDGAEMTMPDGTVMLSPANPPGDNP